MIELRHFHVDKYVLLEPNGKTKGSCKQLPNIILLLLTLVMVFLALNYARDTASTVYANGDMDGEVFKGKTVVLNAGES